MRDKNAPFRDRLAFCLYACFVSLDTSEAFNQHTRRRVLHNQSKVTLKAVPPIFSHSGWYG
jgi:hypothetical protein